MSLSVKPEMVNHASFIVFATFLHQYDISDISRLLSC